MFEQNLSKGLEKKEVSKKKLKKKEMQNQKIVSMWLWPSGQNLRPVSIITHIYMFCTK